MSEPYVNILRLSWAKSATTTSSLLREVPSGAWQRSTAAIPPVADNPTLLIHKSNLRLGFHPSASQQTETMQWKPAGVVNILTKNRLWLSKSARWETFSPELRRLKCWTVMCGLWRDVIPEDHKGKRSQFQMGLKLVHISLKVNDSNKTKICQSISQNFLKTV